MWGYKIKIDKNDTLYSKIIRFGKTRCDKCVCVKALQCAHIFSRRHYATRFLLKPKPNAIALCTSCHDWFDSHKSTDILLKEELQKIPQLDSSYHFLVSRLGYSWECLLKMKILSQGVGNYSQNRNKIYTELKTELERLERVSA